MSVPLRNALPGSVVAEASYGPFDRQQLQRYAEASGDSNPLHLDTQFARRAGFDDVIVHGMLGMALLGRLVTEHLPMVRLTRLRTRFRAVIELGQSIACAATLVRLNSETAEVELIGRNASGMLVLEGSATLELPAAAQRREVPSRP
jgi:acyl dehydratase